MRVATAAVRQSGTNRRILGAASAVIVATPAVKVAAMAKEFAVAGVFGRSDALEAFLVAALIPCLRIT